MSSCSTATLDFMLQQQTSGGEEFLIRHVRPMTNMLLQSSYDNLSLSSYLSSEEGFFRCLAPRCGAGQIHPSGTAEPIFRCGSCQTRSCIVCNVLWHEGRTCAQYQQELEEANQTDEQRMQQLAVIKTQEEASAATLEGISKTCPGVGCGARIQKNGGCDHMTVSV